MPPLPRSRARRCAQTSRHYTSSCLPLTCLAIAFDCSYESSYCPSVALYLPFVSSFANSTNSLSFANFLSSMHQNLSAVSSSCCSGYLSFDCVPFISSSSLSTSMYRAQFSTIDPSNYCFFSFYYYCSSQYWPLPSSILRITYLWFEFWRTGWSTSVSMSNQETWTWYQSNKCLELLHLGSFTFDAWWLECAPPASPWSYLFPFSFLTGRGSHSWI